MSVALDNELRAVSETVAGTPAVGFAYDADGLLASAGGLSLSRSANTGLLTATSIGQVQTSIARDGLGEPTGLAATAAGSGVFEVAYVERDGLGRIVERSETTGGTTTVDEYEYDAAGRLARVVRDGVEVGAYGYDAAGNLTADTTGGVAVTATYDARDQILSWGDHTFTHTPTGERATATDTATDQTTTYLWSSGRLAGADLADGTEIRYLLDGDGRRVGVKVDGTLTGGYLWQGDRVVAELDGAGGVAARFVYATRGHVPDLMVKGSDTYRLVSDERGSPRLIVKTSDGSVAQRLDYDPWGRITTDTNPGFQPFGFAGGLLDADTGLVLFGERSYDPTTARWTSRDPIGFSGGLNHYAYVEGDPINNIDPTGLLSIGCFKDMLLVASFIPGVGATATVAYLAISAARGDWGDLAMAAGGIGIAFGGALLAAKALRTLRTARAPTTAAIKPGASGGPTAGQPFSSSVRNAAKAENPTATCVYCRVDGVATHVDHAIPRVHGGNATLENAQLACPWCNLSKGARDYPVNPPPWYEGRWPPPWWSG